MNAYDSTLFNNGSNPKKKVEARSGLQSVGHWLYPVRMIILTVVLVIASLPVYKELVGKSQWPEQYRFRLEQKKQMISWLQKIILPKKGKEIVD